MHQDTKITSIAASISLNQHKSQQKLPFLSLFFVHTQFGSTGEKTRKKQ